MFGLLADSKSKCSPCTSLHPPPSLTNLHLRLHSLVKSHASERRSGAPTGADAGWRNDDGGMKTVRVRLRFGGQVTGEVDRVVRPTPPSPHTTHHS